MPSPLRIGQIGVGGYGRRHLSTLRTLAVGGACRIVAVADPFADRQPATVAALKAEGAEIYDDAAALLAREDIDAVSIATPIPLHVPQTLAALESGKHVYLEKPPCVTIGEWENLREAEARSGKKVAVGFQHQSTPSLRYLKQQLVSGAIGNLQTVWVAARWGRGDDYYSRAPWSGKWAINGAPVFDGPATNALSHAVCAVLFLAGENEAEPCVVGRVRASLKRARPLESYDTSYIEVETKSGVQVRMLFTHATSLSDSVFLRCAGTKGSAAISWDGSTLINSQSGPPQEALFDCDSHLTAMLDFFRAVTDPAARPATSLADTLPYLQAVNGALQSSKGASDFEPELVKRVEENTSDPYYLVDGLEDQIASFAENPHKVPQLLDPARNNWLRPSEISREWTNPANIT